MSTTANKTTDKVAFKQPHICMGQPVLYYPRSIMNSGNAMVGYVVGISNRNLELSVNNIHRPGVSHKDDPILKTNKHAKEFGCWELSHRDAEINARLEALEAATASPNKK